MSHKYKQQKNSLQLKTKAKQKKNQQTLFSTLVFNIDWRYQNKIIYIYYVERNEFCALYYFFKFVS